MLETIFLMRASSHFNVEIGVKYQMVSEIVVFLLWPCLAFWGTLGFKDLSLLSDFFQTAAEY